MNHRRVDLERGRPSIMNSNIIHAPAWKQNTTRSNTPHWCVQKRDIRRVAVKGGGLPRQQIAPGSWTIPTTMSHPSCTTRACCCTTLLGIISHSFHSFHRLYSRKVFLRFAPAPRVQHHKSSIANPAPQFQHHQSTAIFPSSIHLFSAEFAAVVYPRQTTMDAKLNQEHITEMQNQPAAQVLSRYARRSLYYNIHAAVRITM